MSAIMPEMGPMPEVHSPTEAADRLRRLTPADSYRLERIARARAFDLDLSWEDLLQEAFGRVLAGTRRWPRGVDFMPFLVQTIRSLSTEERRQSAARPFVRTSTEQGDPSGLPLAIADDQPSPEAAVSAKLRLATVLDLFADDLDVRRLIEGLERGETAAQTATRAGMTKQQHDAARKRLKRGIERVVDSEGYN